MIGGVEVGAQRFGDDDHLLSRALVGEGHPSTGMALERRTVDAGVELGDPGDSVRPPVIVDLDEGVLAAGLHGYAKGFEKLLQARFSALQGLQAVPGKGVKLDAYGNLPGSLYNQILSSLQAQRDGYTNTMDRSLTRRIRAGKKVDYFVGRPGHGSQPLGVWARSYKLLAAPPDGRVRAARGTTVTLAFGKKMQGHYIATKITPVLLFVRPASYKPRLGFYRMVQDLVDQQYAEIFRAAIERAIATRKA